VLSVVLLSRTSPALSTKSGEPQGARAYSVQCAEESREPLAWQTITVVTAPNARITELPSTRKYWFRAAAVGAAGQGPWSEPVLRVIG
jgi:hypothetical protein